MARRTLHAGLVPLLASAQLLFAGCGEPAPVVARLEVTPAEVDLSYPRFTSLRLSWLPFVAAESLGAEPTVFVHLLDHAGEVVRTFDHPLPDWRNGSPCIYEIPIYQSALAPGLAVGEYQLTIGLYDPTLGRFRLETVGEGVSEVRRQEYRFGRVRVSEPAAGQPELRFSEAWLERKLGRDKQVLAQRWLSESGALTLAGMPGPLELSARFELPDADHDPELFLLMREGSSGKPRVRISQSCGDEVVFLDEPGLHDVRLVMSPSEPGGSCSVRLSANFVLATPADEERHVVALQAIGWRPLPSEPAAGPAS